MGRKKDDEMMGALGKRLEGRQDTTPPPTSSDSARLEEHAPGSQDLAASKARKKPARQDKHFIGFYAETEMKEKLRVLAFETRRQHQDLMQEAMTLLFMKYGSNR